MTTRGTAPSALATGIALGALLVTASAVFQPSIYERWFAIPLLLVPLFLVRPLSGARWFRKLLAGWNATSLLILAQFFRAGLVCLIPWTESMTVLGVMAFLLGLGTGAASLLRTWIRRGFAWGPAAAEGVLVAGGAVIGVMLAMKTNGSASLYSAAGLYLLSALLDARSGCVRIAPEFAP
jgi:hypothetical protein